MRNKFEIENSTSTNDSLYLSFIEESQISNIIFEDKTYSAITYVKGLSENLRGILKPKFPQKLITFKHKNTIRNKLFNKIKLKTDIEELSNVVYLVTCENCGLKLKYIDQTSNRVWVRMNGHRSNVRNLNRTCCKLAEHVKPTGHNLDLKNVKVLHTERNKYKRDILEMV